MNRVVYVLNGPNLNLLGKRQPHIYGHETLADVEADCRKVAAEHGLEIHFHQSNREYEIIDWIHKAREPHPALSSIPPHSPIRRWPSSTRSMRSTAS